ncbi:MAG TPA: ATP-dependent DNA ligase [Iamia sp.]|nr:ATP-dependent DNA ligase [Iamia sp.]
MPEPVAPSPTPFAAVVATSAVVAGTASRSAKRDAIAALLGDLDPSEVAVTVGFLTGVPLQGRIGVGWRTLQAAEQPPATEPTLTVLEVDAALTALAGLGGAGSGGERRRLLSALLGRATTDEATFLFRLFGGELRQGALAGVMADAVARTAEVPATVVRRAAMLGGDLPAIAHVALTTGAEGLAAVGLELGRPVQPMLASTAASVAAAVEDLGDAVVDWKLDGIRIQVHRRGDQVGIWTRNLNEITGRLPEVVDLVRALPAERLVLDGEALVVDDALRPVLFQDTASRIGADGREAPVAVRPWFFDLLHRDGVDLIDAPLHERRASLAEVAGPWQIPGTRTSDPADAAAVLDDALAAGHEGVVVKGASTLYEAGRRGKAWRKVKPVHTLDLVVLAAEWGHGRRRGWLSNLHLGARVDGAGDRDGLVMVGKTFKGMTDELLGWQTEALQAIATGDERTDEAHVVHVRPELVVEVAVDGVQRSTRYSGGVALRFARVLRYRPDKTPAEADTLTEVRALGLRD